MVGNMKGKADFLVKLMQKKELKLALAESVTCGMAAEKLAACKGTSDMLAGSVVVYSPDAKTQLLKISKRTMDKFTCESQEVTDAMVKNLSKLLKADVFAALTGLASDGGSETKEKPIGTVFFSIIYKRKRLRARKVFRGSPSEIREKACMELYRMIRSLIN